MAIRQLASDRWAWQQMQGRQGFRRRLYHPSNVTNWGTVATRGATFWIHVDDEGFGTSMQPLTGGKYLVVFYRNKKKESSVGRGDMDSIHCVPVYEQMLKHEFGNYLTAEAVELRPGDLLCVQWRYLSCVY